MNTKEKFLQLLRSTDEANVALALEIANGIPEVDIEKQLEIYQAVYDAFRQDDTQPLLDTQLIAQFNESKFDSALFGKCLESVPVQLKEFTWLTKLILQGHYFYQIPEVICTLTQLKYLRGGHYLK